MPRWTARSGRSHWPTAATVSDATVFVSAYDGRLHALSPLDGATRWTMSVDTDQFRPGVERTSDRLYVAGADVHALDPVFGKQHWTVTSGAQGHVAVDVGQTVFTSTDRYLWALNPATGTERWEFAPDGSSRAWRLRGISRSSASATRCTPWTGGLALGANNRHMDGHYRHACVPAVSLCYRPAVSQ